MAYETPWGYTAEGQPLDATGRLIDTTTPASSGAQQSLPAAIATNALWQLEAGPNPYLPASMQGGGGGINRAGVWEEAGWLWYLDNNGKPVPFAQAGDTSNQSMTPYQQAQIDLANRQQTYQQQQPNYDLQIAQMQQQNQQSQLAWQREQWGQELAQEQKNYLAQLSANPRSWLEYASAAGTTPAIQPWMIPLMPQQYGMTAAGQAIPGYSATNMSGMQQLTTPSAQYYARMGPTASAQYQGYEQARTGSRPEETQWRMWNMAPPSGGRSLVQTR